MLSFSENDNEGKVLSSCFRIVKYNEGKANIINSTTINFQANFFVHLQELVIFRTD